MNNRLFSCLFLPVLFLPAIAQAEVCKTEDPYPYTAPYEMEQCPPDIQAFLDRANGCAHLAGEESTDEARRAELDNAWEDLQCEYIGCDYSTLFVKYEGDIVFAGVLTDYQTVIYGENAEYGYECADDADGATPPAAPPQNE